VFIPPQHVQTAEKSADMLSRLSLWVDLGYMRQLSHASMRGIRLPNRLRHQTSSRRSLIHLTIAGSRPERDNPTLQLPNPLDRSHQAFLTDVAVAAGYSPPRRCRDRRAHPPHQIEPRTTSRSCLVGCLCRRTCQTRITSVGGSGGTLQER
jgi:hypothetical protein